MKSDAVLVSRSESAKVFDFKFFVTHLNKRFFFQTKSDFSFLDISKRTSG